MYVLTTTNALSLVLEGVEQVLAFRAKVTIPRSQIESIEWHDTFHDWPRMEIRMPGSYIPSWVMAGSYWNEDGWDFVFAKKPKGLLLPALYNVLVITTKKHRYRRIIMSMNQAKANEVLAWWQEG